MKCAITGNSSYEALHEGKVKKETLTLKKDCFLTSSASFSPDPSLLSGFLLKSWKPTQNKSS